MKNEQKTERLNSHRKERMIIKIINSKSKHKTSKEDERTKTEEHTVCKESVRWEGRQIAL